MSDLAQALMVAISIHAKQVDKQNDPYLLHILRVVEAVKDKAKVVAALHDALEDSEGYWELGELVQMLYPAVLSKEELEAIELLSRNLYKKQGYYDYIVSIHYSNNPIAIEVKLADLRDNLERIPPETTASSIEYEKWIHNWSGLKRRYEKSIKNLES